MKNKNITALVFTLNEERRIKFILDNLKNFCNIMIIDGGSTDATEKICRENGAVFLKRPETSSDDVMRLGALKWAYEQAQTNYVMHVYCSHFYPPGLLKAFDQYTQQGNLDAIYHDVVVIRYGTIVHRSVVRRISSACVLYKKSIINFDASRIHHELGFQFNPRTMLRLKAVDQLSLHLFQDEDYLSTEKKHLDYAKTEANQTLKAGYKKVGKYDLFLKPFFKFAYHYFRSGAFMNGSPGLIYALALFQYDLSKNAFLWEMQNSMEKPQAVMANDILRKNLIKQSNQVGF
jgi:glycosyltransferase involved in cell wall biosynthesis